MRFLVIFLALTLVILGLLFFLQPDWAPPAPSAPEAPAPRPAPVQTTEPESSFVPERTLVVCAERGAEHQPGTPERPFRLIQQAADAARPGDRILIRAGLYEESIVLRHSGRPGRPIVFEGERGENGEWLTIVDRSIPVRNWTPARDVGRGVYVTRDIPFIPATLTLDGRQVVRIRDDWMAEERGLRLLAMHPEEPANGSAYIRGISPSLLARPGAEHPFWDGIEVMYGYRDGATYIRFRRGDDPNGRIIRAASAGEDLAGRADYPAAQGIRVGAPAPGFLMENVQHVVLRNLHIRSAEISVLVRGRDATHNIIEDNRFEHGRIRVSLFDGPAHNVIRNNQMTLGFHGHPLPGAWGSHVLNAHIYRTFKYLVGPGTSDDRAIMLYETGPGNRIESNDMFAGLIGVSAIRSPGLRVSGNMIRNMSSIGLLSSVTDGRSNVDAHYHDNVLYDCNLNVRIHLYHSTLPGERREYYYRNIFTNPPGTGSDVFVHWGLDHELGAGRGHSELYFYHNVFTSSQLFRPGLGNRLEKTVLVNNVFDGAQPSNPLEFRAQEGVFAAFDYNWFPIRGAGTPAFFGAPWYGQGNRVVVASTQTFIHRSLRIWDPDAGLPDFVLPPRHDAREAGIDVSRPFVAAGRRFDPLPGMEPGYFRGSAPHMGALQEGESARPVLRRVELRPD